VAFKHHEFGKRAVDFVQRLQLTDHDEIRICSRTSALMAASAAARSGFRVPAHRRRRAVGAVSL